MLTYEQAVDALSQMQERAGRIELTRMREFLRRLGVENGGSAKFIHIAGTNGKGSTTAIAQAIGIAQGYKTGGYFSPYVFDLRERVQMNGELIPKDDFARLMSKIMPVAESMRDSEFGGPTEFEVKTALGFLHWQAERAELVALEVGLGGRFDSTNVVDPAVSVITSISLDHQKILGDTIAEIAGEKAGIIKPNRPLVLGEVPDEAATVILKRAEEHVCEIWRYGQEIRTEGNHNLFQVTTPYSNYPGLALGLYGDKQVHNAALAIAAYEMAELLRDPIAVNAGTSEANLPGRFQEISIAGRTVILDGAHNEESARVLADNIRAKFGGNVILMVGMLHGHDPAAFAESVKGAVDEVALVPISFRKGRAPEELLACFQQRLRNVGVHDSLASAINHVWGSTDTRPVVVTGSFYLLSDFMDAVKLLKLSVAG